MTATAEPIAEPPAPCPSYPVDCAAWNGARCTKVETRRPDDLRSDAIGPPCVGRVGILGCFEPRSKEKE